MSALVLDVDFESVVVFGVVLELGAALASVGEFSASMGFARNAKIVASKNIAKLGIKAAIPSENSCSETSRSIKTANERTVAVK